MALAAAWAELYAECEDWSGVLFKPPQAPQTLVKVGDNSCGIQEARCVKDEPDSEHNPESCEALVAPLSGKIKEEFQQDTEQQQLVNITSSDHVGNRESMLKLKCVKEEPISEYDQNVSEAVQALLTDLSINNEFALNSGEFQPVNLITSDNGLKLPHTQEMTSTVKRQVKHQTVLASAVSAIIDEVDKLASKPNSFVTSSEDADPARGSKDSSCAIVSGESALQQIVAGCYVKLQRLRLMRCSVCKKMFHKYSSIMNHYTESHVTKTFHIVQENSVSVEKHATDLANIAKLNLNRVPAKSVSIEKHATDLANIAKLNLNRVPAKSVSIEKRATDLANIAKLNLNKVPAKNVSIEKRATDVANIAKLQPCDICSEKFAFKAEMLIHQQMQHRGKGSLSCESQKLVHKSKKEFVEKERVHENCHTIEKQYHCDVCGKQYNHLNKFNNHIMKLHYGMKLYSCKFCKETFTFREEIIRHLPSHITDRRFPHHSGLKSNWVTHMDKLARAKQNLQCGYCYKKMHNRSTLLEHMKQHFYTHRPTTSEQQYTELYSCDQCGLHFHLLSRLNKHRVTHTYI